ncbi:hypothetical protein ACI2KR_06520 [Pseudomonas luteola]
MSNNEAESLEKRSASKASRGPLFDVLKKSLRLKKPCVNCPFLKEGAIHLRKGRLEGITQALIDDDGMDFPCHKTTMASKGGTFDDEGNYVSSGHEAICAGAIAYQLKAASQSVRLRMGVALGVVKLSDWDEARRVTIDPELPVKRTPLKRTPSDE